MYSYRCTEATREEGVVGNRERQEGREVNRYESPYTPGGGTVPDVVIKGRQGSGKLVGGLEGRVVAFDVIR